MYFEILILELPIKGQAYKLVFEYIEAFYNTKRIHSHCDYMSPDDFEKLYAKVQNGSLLLAG